MSFETFASALTGLPTHFLALLDELGNDGVRKLRRELGVFRVIHYFDETSLAAGAHRQILTCFRHESILVRLTGVIARSEHVLNLRRERAPSAFRTLFFDVQLVRDALEQRIALQNLDLRLE